MPSLAKIAQTDRHSVSLLSDRVSQFLDGATKKPGISPGSSIIGDLGFEPRLTAPEAVVLPLHQSPVLHFQ